MNKAIALLAALIFIFGTPAIVWAGVETANAEKIKSEQPKNWEFDMGMQRFIMSYTNYEIGTSVEPFQQPLSRLEFPLNTWWLDLRLRYTTPRWSAGGRSGLKVARRMDGLMKDSDWEREVTPEMKTTYSESAADMEQGYLFRGDIDVNIADFLGLPSSVEIRPLFAFQFQRFAIMAHDGVQWSNGHYPTDEDLSFDGPYTSSQALPGNVIHFREDFYSFLIGLRGSYDLFKWKYLTLKTRGEADWGPALVFYEDHHVQRAGDLFAYGKGQGNALYFMSGMELVIARSLTMGIDMDYYWMGTTRATTSQRNIPTKSDISWNNGVKMWTNQTSLIAHVSYAF